MKLVSSYSVELVHFNHIADATIRIYRNALSYLVNVFLAEWIYLSAIERKTKQFNEAEHFVHTTKNNFAKYDFDTQFPKMPSYMRRAAIQAALGILSSYKSNHQNWEENNKQGKEPTLPKTFPYAMPCFYNGDMYKAGDGDILYLKLFVQNDWRFVAVRGKHTDLQYLRRHWSGVKASAPVLEKHYGKYYLRFAYETITTLKSPDFNEMIVCGVDLGINTDAVCTIMRTDGTILDRKFINFPSEKDHLHHVLNRIRKFQKKHGSHDVSSFWSYAKYLNEELARKIAFAIDEYATLWSVDVVVFEYLDFSKKKVRSRKRRQKLHMWRKGSIQGIVEGKVHRWGCRISRICAWNTSALAYDGSGKLQRDEANHALATFSNGKRYNCDLSASYNIAARYIIREALKPLCANTRSQLLAKVPEAGRRTSCTYHTLLQLRAAMAA